MIRKLFTEPSLKKTIIAVIATAVFVVLCGFVMREFMMYITSLGGKHKFSVDFKLMLSPRTWGVGAVSFVLLGIIYLFSSNNLDLFLGTGKGLLGKDGKADVVRGSLENSRFLTDKERDSYFPAHDYSDLKNCDKDGIPVRAVLDKHNHLQVNFLSGAHSLIIGATGSGKTTTFI